MMLSLEDNNYFDAECFAGLQLDGGGCRGLPDTASQPVSASTGHSQPWGGSTDLPTGNASWFAEEVEIGSATASSSYSSPTWDHVTPVGEGDPWTTNDPWSAHANASRAEARAPPPPPPDPPEAVAAVAGPGHWARQQGSGGWEHLDAPPPWRPGPPRAEE